MAKTLKSQNLYFVTLQIHCNINATYFTYYTLHIKRMYTEKNGNGVDSEENGGGGGGVGKLQGADR